MIAQLTPREKFLASIVGGALFVLVNLFMLKAFMNKNVELKLAADKAQMGIAENQAREADRSLWEQRDLWLNQNLQPLGDGDDANQKLRDTLVDMGKKHSLVLESPSLGIPNAQPFYTSLSIGIQTKGPWAAVFDFLRELQAPGNFIVLESAKLEVDPAEKTQMKAEFRVAKWFKPQPQAAAR